MIERADMPVFSDTDESEELPLDGMPRGQDVKAAFSKPGGGTIPAFGGIPYPPNERFRIESVPACMFGVRYRVTTLYERPVVELNGLIYRHPTMVSANCPPGTENYTKPGTNLWAMVQIDIASVWSLRSESNYEQKLFGGRTSQVGFIPFVSASFDKSGGFLSYFAPQHGRTYTFEVWLRDATHGRDLYFNRGHGQAPAPLSITVHVP